jgi:hypothetical protein
MELNELPGSELILPGLEDIYLIYLLKSFVLWEIRKDSMQ